MRQNSRIVKRIVAGGSAGLVATIPMTLTMVGIKHSLPLWQRHSLPPRKITMRMARAVNLRRFLHRKKGKVATAFSHFGYGAATGAIYGALRKSRGRTGLLSGTIFGLAVWAGSYLGWLPATNILRSDWETKERHAMMAASHMVWGGALGILFQRFRRM